MAGPRIVRNRHKIEATVANALNQQEGGFRALLGSQGGFEGTVKVLTKQFKFFGGLGAYYFLWVVSEPVPPTKIGPSLGGSLPELRCGDEGDGRAEASWSATRSKRCARWA